MKIPFNGSWCSKKMYKAIRIIIATLFAPLFIVSLVLFGLQVVAEVSEKKLYKATRFMLCVGDMCLAKLHKWFPKVYGR